MTDLKIGLLWHSMNSDNLGVGALTVAHMALAARAAARAGRTPHFTVLGWADPKPPYFTADNLEIASFRLGDFAKARGGFVERAKGQDIILDIGAGDSFSDIYGASRILKMIAAQNLVRLAGAPLVMAPQTIGPFENPLVERLALSVLRQADLVATRDCLSTACAREMGFDDDIVEATDVALGLDYEPPTRADDGKVRVGLNVSGLLYNGGYSRDNMFDLKADYRTLIDAAVSAFASRAGVEVHLVGHVLSETQPIEDDYRACLDLAERREGVIVAPKFKTPSEAKSYIAGMDFFAGSRMHACIAAFSSGVPTLPLAYSRKFRGLFGSLGYDAVADCKTDDATAILSRLSEAFENRENLKARAIVSARRGRARLDAYEASLARLFADLPIMRAAS
ncbi:MAG: polysaccharide pyruvyl transferase family protein [Parvularculaceae bacterium]